MKRIVLKIRLLEDSKILLRLFHIDKRFLSIPGDMGFYQTKDHKFCIYSNDHLAISLNSIRFPKLSKYKKQQEIEFKFHSEDERKNYLKKLFGALHEWNDNFIGFRKSNDHERRNSKMIISDEFWVI
jgi:hypothetical protein